MRKIVRDIQCTRVQVLECSNGAVSEIGIMTLSGSPDIKKIKKELSKKYPDKNAFYGTIETDEKRYEMTAEEFMKYATVVE